MGRGEAPARGLGLVEVLVGMAILGLVLIGYSLLQASGNRARASQELVANQLQLEELAVELLAADLRVAGFRLGPEVAPALAVGRALGEGGNDRIEVHFLEDRFLADPRVERVALSVGRDRAGRWNLYRSEAGAVRQPAVAGVAGLRLVRVQDASDGRWYEVGTAFLPGTTILALELELGFVWGKVRRLLIPLGNEPSFHLEGG